VLEFAGAAGVLVRVLLEVRTHFQTIVQFVPTLEV
jgi:hypothetical protein